MANRQVFKSSRRSTPVADTLNRAGGKAYRLTDAEALCQYAVTGCFGSTYYTSARTQLDQIQKLTEGVDPVLIAKAAIYGRQHGNMKDMPAYLLAVLAAKGEIDLLRAAWTRVIDNPKMMYNFVQIVRSGVTGRKSFGTAVRNLIREWFASRSGDQLYRASIGASNPSMADVIKMVHPTPDNYEKSALFAYLLGAKLEDGDVLSRYNRDGEILQQYHLTDCPQLVQDVEWFKYDNSHPVPALDYRALTNYNLTLDHWKQIARNMPWNALRMNLNVLQRNGVFGDAKLTKELAAKLGDEKQVRKWNAFPYQLLTTYQNTIDMPVVIRNALQAAMEIATENIPKLGDVTVCIDLSGSMHSPITGYRPGVSSVTQCVDVAALIASSIARTNKDAIVIAWATRAAQVHFNAYDSIMSNAQKFRHCNVGGGTNASLALKMLNTARHTDKTVVYVSDNQSWLDRGCYWGGSSTAMADQWASYSRRVKGAKLVCIDLTPNTTTQVKNRDDVLNIGGFSDAVFDVIGNFVNYSGESFVNTVMDVNFYDNKD